MGEYIEAELIERKTPAHKPVKDMFPVIAITCFAAILGGAGWYAIDDHNKFQDSAAQLTKRLANGEGDTYQIIFDKTANAACFKRAGRPVICLPRSAEISDLTAN